jgi:hypothetical protein
MDDFEKLSNHVSRCAHKMGCHPIEAVARLLEERVGHYYSRETAIEYANRRLTPHGLKLIDNPGLRATSTTSANTPTTAPTLTIVPPL